MYLPNLGKAFKKEMEAWFAYYPDVPHRWQENQLSISHPREEEKFIQFQFDSKSVKVSFEGKEKVFKRKLFSNIREQISKIQAYWIHNLVKSEDSNIKKPELQENQFAVMICNAKYGHVLTISKNLFTGWGEVYQIFDNEEEARRFIKEEANDTEIELHLYNSQYESILSCGGK